MQLFTADLAAISALNKFLQKGFSFTTTRSNYYFTITCNVLYFYAYNFSATLSRLLRSVCAVVFVSANNIKRLRLRLSVSKRVYMVKSSQS